jgi:hypothetical protein
MLRPIARLYCRTRAFTEESMFFSPPVEAWNPKMDRTPKMPRTQEPYGDTTHKLLSREIREARVW